MQRCIEWTRRYATGAPGGLGFGAELWADVSAHPAAARLQALSRIHRWNFDAGDIRYRITRPLLPALADSDRKDQVQRFHDELAGWVEAEGYLAGFALHIGRLHSGTPSFRRERDGRVRFLLPDRPGDRVWSWEEFTYRHNRDARTVAVDLLGRVERFMDGLLTSFEQHVPERFRS